MKIFFFILFLSVPCFAKGPKYHYEDTNLNDEMDNIYKDIPNVLKATPVRISSVTVSSATITNLTVTNCTGCSAATPTSLTISTLTVTSSTTLRGTQTNDSAAAGNIGEYVFSTISNTNFPSTGVWGDATSISLTAGDWDISANSYIAISGSTWTDFQLGISATSGNATTGLVIGDNRVLIGISAGINPNQLELSVSSWRASINATTIYYLKYEGDYTISTPVIYVRMSARRIR